MKEIKAYIRVDRAPMVLDALSAAGITSAMLTHVLTVGTDTACENVKMNIEFGCNVSRMVKLEVICLDKEEFRTVELIREAACTTRPGDGIISVTNVNRLVKIHTAGESIDALKKDE